MRLQAKYQGAFIQLYIILIVILEITCKEWNQISQTRTTYLETYKNYINTVIMHFDVPENAISATFKFRGRNSEGMFGCPAHDVELYMQYGAPPVINPDQSSFPKGFLLSRREDINNITFKTNQVYESIYYGNVHPGSYYAAVFFPYVNPKDKGITQDGLFPKCHSFVDATLLVQQVNITPIVSEQIIPVRLKTDDAELYKIYLPWNVYKIRLVITEFNLCLDCDKVQILVSGHSTQISHPNVTIEDDLVIPLSIMGDDDYYIKVLSVDSTTHKSQTKPSTTNFNLKVEFIETPMYEENLKLYKAKKHWPKLGLNFTKEDKQLLERKHKEMFNLNSSQIYITSKLFDSPVAIQYDEYNMYKTISTDSFQFGYELEPMEEYAGYVPININITSVGFTSLKFLIRDVLDVGGTLNIALAYKPRFKRLGKRMYVDKEPKNHTIVACFHRGAIEVPIWENKCQYMSRISTSPLLLNASVTNATFMVPYPEPGNWYLTFKLFCGACAPCDCPKKCKDSMRECLDSCEASCGEDCHKCQDRCEKVVVEDKVDCNGCDCDGNCLKTNIEDGDDCKSSILFDISSYPCVDDCGSNGHCMYGLAEGYVYSTCVCSNNYKGWDCKDDSNANTLFTIWLELILLVFSNFTFMITVFVAYKRSCYIEALTYAAILIASTFYHACDAGENRINFCLVNLNVLQFLDFYCAILAIWVTLISMAYLSRPFPHLLHIAGAIFLGGAVTMDKTSLWVFVIPVAVGAVIVLASWGTKNYYLRKANNGNIKIFPSKRYLTIYLPIGLLVALVALLGFALFQTQSNYKYVHSMWHMLMAISVVLLLPKEENFIPKPDIVSDHENGNVNNSY